MKKAKVRFLSVLLVHAAATHVTFSRRLGNSPPGLNQDSTPAEILNLLDKTVLPQAQVGFSWGSCCDSDEAMRRGISDAPGAARMFFSEGFRLARLDGCHLTLRHES